MKQHTKLWLTKPSVLMDTRWRNNEWGPALKNQNSQVDFWSTTMLGGGKTRSITPGTAGILFRKRHHYFVGNVVIAQTNLACNCNCPYRMFVEPNFRSAYLTPNYKKQCTFRNTRSSFFFSIPIFLNLPTTIR